MIYFCCADKKNKLTWFVAMRYTWKQVRPPTNQRKKKAYAIRIIDAGDSFIAFQTVP